MQEQNANIRVVVAEGDGTRHGLLRFVLVGEGFDVVAAVSTQAELVRAADAERPGCIVIDDQIGAGAIAMTRAVARGVPIVMVSPSPSAAEVDEWVRLSDVLRGLGAAVSRLASGERIAAAGGSSQTSTFARPDWVDRIRKDPATLREILASKTAADARPSVTELQRRSRQPRLHPSMVWRRESATEGGSKPVVAEPASRPTGSDRLVVLPDLEARDAAIERRNRKLGGMALGAAAVAGAFVLGFTFGRGDTGIVGWDAAESAPIVQPQPQLLPGTQSIGTADHRTGDRRGGGGEGHSGLSGSATPGPSGAGGSDPGTTHGSAPGPGSPPGHSGEHNPHGGPPGQDKAKPAHPGRSGHHVALRAHPRKR